MQFKFKPVAWMTTILSVLTALMTLDQTGAVDVVPTRFEPWVLGAIAVLTAILGAVVHNKVTPLAEPRAANGRRLVPTPPAKVPPGVGPTALDATRE